MAFRSTKDAEFSEADNEDLSISTSGQSNGSKTGPTREASKKRIQLAKLETQAVGGLRCFVICVLLLSTIGVALTVYFYTSGQEQKAFETRFVDDADKVLSGISNSMQSTLSGADALVVSLVSSARSAKQTWPFVIFDDFGVRAEKFRVMTNALYLCVYPYVANKTMRYEWEPFTAEEGPKWVQQSLELQQKENMFQDIIEEYNVTDITNITQWNVIWNYDEYAKPFEEWGQVGMDPNDNGPFMPSWQISPVITTGSIVTYNWNLLSIMNKSAPESVLETHKVSIRSAYQIEDPNDPALTAQAIEDAAWSGIYLTNGEEAMEPMSDIYYPIIVDEAADSINLFKGGDYDPSEHELGGILDISFYWRDMIKEILPYGSSGVVVSFENPCNPTFAYEINGPTVKYMGSGSTFYTDETLAYLERSEQLYELSTWTSKNGYSGIPINEAICPFTIRVSPSARYKSSFITKNPAIFTSFAVAIFIFTSLVFLFYDFAVEHRQNVVMQSAVRSDAIVEMETTIHRALRTS